ncbi:Glutathione S-transferase C-terminal domain-containing protein [Porphyridium purpureum]|uniref:Glutathione S-transferase C-terminal domain-containing protein n=1 Tax=Porphyridium purpureum TaxID=35688 RepID=A0A5J4Z7T3_PORPP|nr:Glutathione S-transferase C-terminal domain-containing protein [Porphyridium purpureum]|eukprot:POR4473..scf295_1
MSTRDSERAALGGVTPTQSEALVASLLDAGVCESNPYSVLKNDNVSSATAERSHIERCCPCEAQSSSSLAVSCCSYLHEQCKYAQFVENGFDALPAHVNPGGAHAGTMAESRGSNKRAQLSILVRLCTELSRRKRRAKHSAAASQTQKTFTVVDFCGGCGHVALTLAAVHPGWHLTVVDVNPRALSIAMERAQDASLDNVSVWAGHAADFHGQFDLAVGLHACGMASDVVIASALSRRAPFVVVPCCTGSVTPRSDQFLSSYRYTRNKQFCSDNASKRAVVDAQAEPEEAMLSRSARSAVFSELLSDESFADLARAADFETRMVSEDARYCWRRMAKTLLELDRCFAAGESLYCTRLLKLRPLCASPKNDILVGWPQESDRGADGQVCTCRQISTAFEPDLLMEHICEQVRNNVDFSVEHFERFSSDLKAFKRLDLGNELILADGVGKKIRKAAHAAAEECGLYHHSRGEGKQRKVLVRKSLMWPWWPADGFFALFGDQIERVAARAFSVEQLVPAAWAEQRRQARGAAHHLTLLGPADVRRCGYARAHAALTSWAGRMLDAQRQAEIDALGIGFARRSPADGGADQASCCFVVVQWREGQAFRRHLQLPETDFHITLGFSGSGDVHGVRKDASTLSHRWE